MEKKVFPNWDGIIWLPKIGEAKSRRMRGLVESQVIGQKKAELGLPKLTLTSGLPAPPARRGWDRVGEAAAQFSEPERLCGTLCAHYQRVVPEPIDTLRRGFFAQGSLGVRGALPSGTQSSGTRESTDHSRDQSGRLQRRDSATTATRRNAELLSPRSVSTLTRVIFRTLMPFSSGGRCLFVAPPAQFIAAIEPKHHRTVPPGCPPVLFSSDLVARSSFWTVRGYGLTAKAAMYQR